MAPLECDKCCRHCLRRNVIGTCACKEILHKHGRFHEHNWVPFINGLSSCIFPESISSHGNLVPVTRLPPYSSTPKFLLLITFLQSRFSQFPFISFLRDYSPISEMESGSSWITTLLSEISLHDCQILFLTCIIPVTS